MTLACACCAKQFEAKRSTAKFCGNVCRQRAFVSRRQSGEVATIAAPRPPTPVGLVAVVERVLAEADRLDTVAGQMAVQLARSSGAPGATPSAVASATRELRVVMDEALLGVVVESDPLDELQAKRDAKRAAAAG